MAEKTVVELLDEIVEKKFVSLEAAEHIAKIRARNLALEAEIKKLCDQFDKMNELNQKLLATSAETAKELTTWRACNDALIAREKNITVLELTAKFEAEKTTLAKELFTSVFRNLETRRTITSVVPISMVTGNNGTQSSYVSQHTSTETVAEEQK